MIGFRTITLDDLIDALGDEKAEGILTGYSCPINADIEDFLKHKAVTFSRQGLAKTHLVFTSFKDETVLVGYFSLASKALFIPDKVSLSRNLRQRMAKFATRIPETKMTVINAPLIAQLGKNYNNGYNELITGDDLLKMACETIQRIQLSIGGKIAYLECENKPKLIQFYESNGFRAFSERITNDSTHLVQMIRYF